LFAGILLFVTAVALVGWQANAPVQWDAVALKKGIEDIGYEPKNISREADQEKYEFKLERGGLNIPISAEITSSKNYIWLLAVLATDVKEESYSASKLFKILQANGNIQPAQFFITRNGRLLVGQAIENRNVTNAILRRVVEKLATNVVETKELWQK
jgi:hypothetical protein